MVFDKKWFNRLYYKWLEGVYNKDPELAKELDTAVIGGLGRRMAREIKDQIPQTQNEMDYLLKALRESHWFQENVGVVGKSNNEMILQTRNCSFQLAWMKKHGDVYPCKVSHKTFLENFCREVDPNLKVENLSAPTKNPKGGVYCRWKIYK